MVRKQRTEQVIKANAGPLTGRIKSQTFSKTENEKNRISTKTVAEIQRHNKYRQKYTEKKQRISHIT